MISDICCWFGGSHAWYFALASCIGFFTAFAELLTRYNYDFRSIWRISAGWVYMLINAGAGFLAYFIMGKLEMFEGNESVGAIVAGTSAMLVLRSSFIVIKNHDKQIDIGLASILNVFLQAANRGFAQQRSAERLDKMAIMKDVDFEKAKEVLPDLCFLSMKEVSDEDKTSITQKIRVVGSSNTPNGNKSLQLGIILAEITEINLLKKAIEKLGDTIKFDSGSEPVKPIDQQVDEVMNRVKKQ